MTFDEVLSLAREATPESPLPIVVSPCLLGEPVGWNGSCWPSDPVRRLCALASVRVHRFCPENHTLGTPREAMQVHGGDGYDVLDGRAEVVTLGGRDVTAEFRESAAEMLDIARRNDAVLGILTDSSPSCGANVIHRGEVPERAYRAAPGVTTAALRRAHVCVVSQRDYESLDRLLTALDPTFEADPDSFDFVEDPWYREYFGDRVNREAEP